MFNPKWDRSECTYENYFFIGNGFDLKMGLKSRYKDFYNYLLSQNYENIIVDKIKDNPDEWADFELACGKELRNITIDNMEEFIGAFGNFKIRVFKISIRTRERY